MRRRAFPCETEGGGQGDDPSEHGLFGVVGGGDVGVRGTFDEAGLRWDGRRQHKLELEFIVLWRRRGRGFGDGRRERDGRREQR